MAPLRVPHFTWCCSTSGAASSFPVTFDALIDNGLHTVLICKEFVNELALRCRKLLVPEVIKMAMEGAGKKVIVPLYEWVKLKVYDPSSWWTVRTVCAIVAPGLCSPVILGIPFLSHNQIVIDHAARTVIDKKCGFDLLHPTAPPMPPPPKERLKDSFL